MIHLIGFHKRSGMILGGTAAVLLSLGVSRGETSRVILNETFESYKTTKALRTVWSGGPAQLMTNAPGGGYCATHDGTGMNRRGGFFVFPDATHNLVLQADFYDFATNTDQNVIVSINGDDTHDNVSMGLKGAFCYVARVGGFSSRTNWIPFKRRQLPMEGWHRFKAVISASNVVATVDFGIDGKVDRSLTIPFDHSPPTFTQVRFGGYSGKLAERGTVLVDNIKLELVTLEPPIAAAGTQEQPVATNVPSEAVVETSPTELAAATSVALSVTSPPVAAATEKLVVVKTQAVASVALANPARTMSSPSHPSDRAQESRSLPAVWWIGGALAIIIGLLTVVITMLKRQSAVIPRALLSETSDAEGESDNRSDVARQHDGLWRERALQAEAVAAKQAQILKDKVGPELVKFAKETLVQGLYNQRNALLETQATAKQALRELEARLSELHLAPSERIREYEKRIAELEKQLESRGDEVRELTRATLLLVQEKLQEERKQQEPRFN